MTPRLYIGAISGTSVDGLDLSLLEATQPPTILAGRTVPIPSDLARLLKGLGSGEVAGLDQFGDADHRLGALIGNSIVGFLADLSLTADRVTAIGSHGQTVRHRPDGPAPFSLQIGDPNLIAEITGIDTIADFRRRDMAAGGQGAPLVPPFHDALFRTAEENRTVLNIGGIANISYLPADLSAPIIGFDTGPGNAMLDAWVERHTGAHLRPRWRLGADWFNRPRPSGATAADAFFDLEPPKSTGKELFNLALVGALRRRPTSPQPDGCPGDPCRTHGDYRRPSHQTLGACNRSGHRLRRRPAQRTSDATAQPLHRADPRRANGILQLRRRLDRGGRVRVARASNDDWSGGKRPGDHRRTRIARTRRLLSEIRLKGQIENELPQPQVDDAFGF